MTSWIQEVEAAGIEEGAEYFVARRGTEHKSNLFWSRGLSGKEQWSVKPGIAIRYVGNDKLRGYLTENPQFVAVRVPADADKRWRRRRPNLSWRK